MTAVLHHSTHTPNTRRLTALSVRILQEIAGALRAWKNRREIYKLGEMTDTQLADIGLTRTDLNVVVQLPFGNDPTVELCSLARGRAIEDCARQVV